MDFPQGEIVPESTLRIESSRAQEKKTPKSATGSQMAEARWGIVGKKARNVDRG